MELSILTDKSIKRNSQSLVSYSNKSEPFLLWNSIKDLDPSLLNRLSSDYSRGLFEGKFLLSTSGSTGHPKVVVASHQRARELCAQLNISQGLHTCSDIIVALPLSYSFAYINQFLISILYNKKLIITNGLLQPSDLIDTIRQSRDSMICLVGSQYNILRKFIINETFENVRVVNFAGGKFPFQYLAEINHIFSNAEIFNNYGCTEAVPRLSITNSRHLSHPSDIGEPLHGISFSIDSNQQLLFKSKYQALGVYSVSNQNVSYHHLNGWVSTGDRASLYGNSYRINGRLIDSFKRYGEFVRPDIVLTFFTTKLNVDFYHYIQDDRNNEQGIVLVTEFEISPIIIRNALKKFVSEYSRVYLPLRLEYVSDIPRLSNGKVAMLDANTISSLSPKILWEQ